jgi:hypothetical protein
MFAGACNIQIYFKTHKRQTGNEDGKLCERKRLKTPLTAVLFQQTHGKVFLLL